VVITFDDERRVAARMLREHRGGAVLVVVPKPRMVPLLGALVPGAKFDAAGSTQAGSLYIVTLPTYGPAKVLRLHY
jgi:hypothetical protein